MNFPSCIDVAFCIRLVVTLGHFLWQATAIAVLAWLAGVLLSEATAVRRAGLRVAGHGGLSRRNLRVHRWLAGRFVAGRSGDNGRPPTAVDGRQTRRPVAPARDCAGRSR